MIFTTLYTYHTPYEALAWRLGESLRKLRLPFYAEGFRSHGSWLKNVHEIPRHCLRMLEKWKCPIVYLDADATVERDPVLLKGLALPYERGGADFAVHHAPAHAQYRNLGGVSRWELADGTMFFRYSPQVLSLVRRWIEADQRNPDLFEQKVLETSLGSWLSEFGLRYKELPVAYCRIFDHALQQEADPNGCAEPVVVHHQASREMRESPVHVYARAANTEQLLGSLHESIAVVGNGEVADGMGAEIDSHESVIRMNNYVLDGHESRVGTKTTAWAVNAWWDVCYEPRGLPVFTTHPPDYQDGRIDRWKEFQKCPHLLSLSDPALAESPLPRPSMGFSLLRILSGLGKKADVYGFDGFRTGHYWDADHLHGHDPGEFSFAKDLAGMTLRS